MPKARAALAAICGVALAHAALYIVYQQPDWTVAWTDQGGYQMLARGLLATGHFTRYPEAATFVPEALRTPGYPMFVAAVHAIAGDSHMAVAVTQALVFAALCLVAYATARQVTSTRVSVAAAAVTAAYPMFPYFGALVLTELWTTFVLTCAMFCCLRAAHTKGLVWFIAAGLLIAFTALTRPVFALFPAFLAVPAIIHIWQSQRRTAALAAWALLSAVFIASMSPWFVYNYSHFGELTLSAAGNLGRPIWEGSWQGVWAGRTQAQLTRIAEQATPDADLETAVQRFARDQGAPAQPMLDYTRQWRTIRVIWTTPTDPEERVRARIAADDEYMRVGLENIKASPVGWVSRRLTRGLFVLWAADVPIRFTQIDATPTWIIRSFWSVQAALMVMAAYGTFCVWRHRGAVSALLMASPIVYVTAVHLPILCEARQSLPVKPLVLVLATIGVANIVGITSRQTEGS